MDYKKEIEKRRTFAIISHPDAGKTTLTEKFLLYGGQINLAGSVKGKATARHAVSDWMEIEKERGISVTSSVLQFEYGCKVRTAALAMQRAVRDEVAYMTAFNVLGVEAEIRGFKFK